MSIFDSKEPIPAKDLTVEDCKEIIKRAVVINNNGDSSSLDLLAMVLLETFKMTNTPF